MKEIPEGFYNEYIYFVLLTKATKPKWMREGRGGGVEALDKWLKRGGSQWSNGDGGIQVFILNASSGSLKAMSRLYLSCLQAMAPNPFH